MSESDVYDLIGVGFGPANLALSIALREAQESTANGLRFCFVEKQAGFAWHPSLLLPGAQLQVSPLKDLVTMRDPTSSFSFTNYLHQRGRLASYINREQTVPSRREWSAYLDWAAKRMHTYVSYGQDVVSVEPINDDDDALQILKVTTKDVKSGKTVTRLTRNITVGVGGLPQVPAAFQGIFQETQGQLSAGQAPSAMLVHSSAYLPTLAKIETQLRSREARRLADASQAQLASSTFPSAVHDQEKHAAPLRFAVIGSGQSSAEISLHLRKTFPNAHVSLIFRATAIVPSDDSPFVNAMAFDPERTDAFWHASEVDRMEWLAEFKRTNYSVVRSDVLNELHTTMYDQSIDYDGLYPHSDGVPSHGQLRLLPNTRVEKAEVVTAPDDSSTHSVALTLADCKSAEGPHARVEVYDAIFMGTGFMRAPSVMPFLKPLQHLYPRLDTNASERKAELGFGGEEDSPENMVKIMAYEGGDEVACDRMRERTRGIARDYRLVSYASDAFSAPRHRRQGRLDAVRTGGNHVRTSSPRQHLAAQQHGESGLYGDESNGQQSGTSSAVMSGASSPRRGSDTALSSGGSSSTLAEEGAMQASKLDGLHGSSYNHLHSAITRSTANAEPAIYFLGGNESTHGLSDSLLSIVAHRAGELSASILERQGYAATVPRADLAQDDAHVVHMKPRGLTPLHKDVSSPVTKIGGLENKFQGMRAA